MSLLSIVILSAHFVLLAILCLFGLHRLSMVVRWYKHRHVQYTVDKKFDSLPKITVQIPVYNERFVAERCIDAVVKFNYPADKLQIQIVDDSTDDSKELIARCVLDYQKQGIDITHVHRSNRVGFKAGALKEAMESATGEFIAIFDADFIPQPNLLLNSIDHFSDPEMGMLQFRWGHLNRHNTELTKTQAIMLDAHFSLEQQVRCASGKLFNFNGTAGIWRTKTIIDAGHWSADTLTEDLDLSYRAQLAGWKMRYLNALECPGELPADMNAFKSQQHRWAKGGVQVMLKLLPTVWRSKLPFSTKLESSFHLSNNLAYFVMLLDTLVFLVPSLLLRQQFDMINIWWVDLPMLLMSSGGHLIYMFYGQVALGHSKWDAFCKTPRLMLLGIQLAINNAKAGIEALRGQESEFVRTPKSGALNKHEQQNSVSAHLYKAVPPKGVIAEFIIALVYFSVFVWAALNEHWFMLPFIFLLAFGFVTTAFSSFKSYLRLAR